jgi:hypothetical protein
MRLYPSTILGTLGDPIDMGSSGIFTLNATNGVTVLLNLSGISGTAQGGYAGPFAATPRSDPDAPSGAIAINGGAPSTPSRNVVLDISATDTPLDGMATPANGAGKGGGPLALAYNTVSGAVEMRIANNPAFTGATWEPLAPTRPWTLADVPFGDTARVFAQFRDAAGNESQVVLDSIIVNAIPVYLPLVKK